jgi:hypothetical protein
LRRSSRWDYHCRQTVLKVQPSSNATVVTTTGKRFLAMNELFKTLAAHVEREAKTVASHFQSYAVDMAADATLAKLLTTASAALQAVHEHLERRREDGAKPLFDVKRYDYVSIPTAKQEPLVTPPNDYGNSDFRKRYGFIDPPDPLPILMSPHPLPIVMGRPPNKHDCSMAGSAHDMQLAEGRSWRQCTKCHALECPKCGNVQNLHFLGSECTGCDVCNNLPSLTESSVSDIGNWLVPSGWYFARRGNGALWSCCHGPTGHWHPIEEQSLVYIPSNDKTGHLYCREHAPLHSAPPVGQPVKLQETLDPLDDRIERLSFVVSGRITSDQPFELTLAPDVGIGVHALLHNAEPGTVQFESVQVEGKEPTPYRELLREFRAGYVMHCPKGKNVTVRGKLMGVGMSHRLTVQFFGLKLGDDVYFSPSLTYCREHAPLHGAPPVGRLNDAPADISDIGNDWGVFRDSPTGGVWCWIDSRIRKRTGTLSEAIATCAGLKSLYKDHNYTVRRYPYYTVR